jgi:4-amino-4-deoxy-L-arabinose transferase-like glycosyltransferase
LITGLLLGLGFLARETFLLIAPAVLGVLAWQGWQRRQPRVLAACVAGFCVCLAPLAVRNLAVGLPPLALSNRFADTFIQGHSARGHPYLYVVPDDMRALMEQSQQGDVALVRATLKTHDGVWPLCRFELSKMFSLLDPYEPPDNLSIYYIAEFSPLVRFGLRHWMLIVPGLGGLIWSAIRRDRRHAWLWLLFPMALAGVLVGVPVSRYRQALAVFWIPWACCLFLWVFQERAHPKKVAAVCAALLAGWALCLGPFSRQPKAAYERPAEFQLSAFIYDQLGLTNEAAQVRTTMAEKFHDISH